MTLSEGDIVEKTESGSGYPVGQEVARKFRVVWVHAAPGYAYPKGFQVVGLETVE